MMRERMRNEGYPSMVLSVLNFFLAEPLCLCAAEICWLSILISPTPTPSWLRHSALTMTSALPYLPCIIKGVFYVSLDLVGLLNPLVAPAQAVFSQGMPFLRHRSNIVPSHS